MKIALYKPCFDVVFNGEDKSSTFINPEVTKLAEVLVEQGNEVVVVSSSDLEPQGNPRSLYKEDIHFDVGILVNGRLYLKGDELDERVKREQEQVRLLFNGKFPQYHCLTDLKIWQRNSEFLGNIDFVPITQSPSLGLYGELETLFLKGSKIIRGAERKNEIVYIGNSRGGARDAAIDEFLITSGIPFALYGNWNKEQFPMSKGKVLFKETPEVLSKFDYALCVSEDLYKTFDHRTPRMWEAFRSGAIVFVECDYPRDTNVISPSNFQVVESGIELKAKMNYLDRHPFEKEKLREHQYSFITPDLQDGSRVGKRLKNILNGYC